MHLSDTVNHQYHTDRQNHADYYKRKLLSVKK